MAAPLRTDPVSFSTLIVGKRPCSVLSTEWEVEEGGKIRAEPCRVPFSLSLRLWNAPLTYPKQIVLTVSPARRKYRSRKCKGMSVQGPRGSRCKGKL